MESEIPSASESDGVFRWAEISDRPERERFAALSKALADSGLANEVEFIETSRDEFPEVLAAAQLKFAQIRIGGELREDVPKLMERLPSTLLTLKAADAMVREGKDWWPRNYTVEGLLRAVAAEIPNLDLGMGAFINGATADARAVVAALVRVGYSRFTISDPDEERAKAMVEDLRTTYFRVQFQAVPRHMITQLPGVHSFAVNSLPLGIDEGSLSELFYFNFLKSGGVWLDLPLVPLNAALEAEARSVGSFVESAASVLARSDLAWLAACLGEGVARAIPVERLISVYSDVAAAAAVQAPPEHLDSQ